MSSAHGPLPKGEGYVLLVEDEPGVLNCLAEALLENGFEVATAGDGASALAFAEKVEKPIDVLVTDLTLPRMSGVELAQQLRAKFPALLVVYISGRAEAQRLRGTIGPRELYIEKPFRPEALVDLLQELRSRSQRP